MLQLLLDRQLEYLFANGELFVDFLLAETEIDNVEEAWHGSGWKGMTDPQLRLTHVTDSIPQLMGKLLLPARSIELREVESYKISPVHCSVLARICLIKRYSCKARGF